MKRYNDEEMKKLSEINKKLGIETENCKKIDKKLEKKAKKIKKELAENELNSELEELEKTKMTHTDIF